ncbi:MAG: rod shape-determining protein MreD [Paracoccus sp. (in: a-proteobacteria)]|uniref:rod shape-determining protein MreD n=1 Tax=Paracoccus sp. TaxID=267 RepID=UPI0026DF9164|nr:rod shape-determining protein MreD [Paracoccus sp. (in: a-proteobacteria)]MDO5632721.1 rod shape-determining protein MreD [Paracoccus sp. (in: a-proteobacteria)]
MIEGARGRMLMGTGLFCICILGLLFVRLLPLNAGTVGWPGPDLGLCLTFAWVLRRPAQVPALLIAVLFLVEDIILYRPIGLWALIVLLGTESARLREQRWREHPFMVEWLRVSILIGVMMLGYRIVQVLVLLPVPALGQVMLQYIATVAAYPLVVVVARWTLGLRRISPADADNLGRSR